MSILPTSTLRAHPNCLPVGARIGEFEVTGLVGEGGFGIVYLARDTALQRNVALKEFMPSALAGRVNGTRVAVRSPDHQAKFDAGLKGFVKEAQLLARFNHPSLVKVYRLLEGNATAYMAMRYYAGETLAKRMSRRGVTFDEAAVECIVAPLFSALEILHQAQVFHRDIAPDNIMLSQEGSVLLDFGSARHIIGEGVQALTAVLKPTYSPVEQYVADGTMRQGAWTDVYALGAVMYQLLAGRGPWAGGGSSLPSLQSIDALRGALGWQALAPLTAVTPTLASFEEKKLTLMKQAGVARPVPPVRQASAAVRSWVLGAGVAVVVFGLVLVYLMRYP